MEEKNNMNNLDKIAEILNQEQNMEGAQRLKDLYFEITGSRYQSGCLCKKPNIIRVYDGIRQWAQSQNK